MKTRLLTSRIPDGFVDDLRAVAAERSLAAAA